MVITQIGLAVGDTEQERQKTEFTKLKAWVGNILKYLIIAHCDEHSFKVMEIPNKLDNYVKSLKYYCIHSDLYRYVKS